MSQEVMAQQLGKLLIGGDLSALSEPQKVQYYMRVCDSLGLNHLTKPFAYIWLNGKLVLYALKACTDQLRKVHGVSIIDSEEKQVGDMFIVTVKAQDKDGRIDVDKGVLPIGHLKGDALANAIMKTVTKAKRRVTLSLCGLGMLDETEIETIPAHAKGEMVMPKDIKELEEDFPRKDEDKAFGPGYLFVKGKFRGSRIKEICFEEMSQYYDRYLKGKSLENPDWIETKEAIEDYIDNHQRYEDILQEIREETA